MNKHSGGDKCKFKVGQWQNIEEKEGKAGADELLDPPATASAPSSNRRKPLNRR